MSTPKRPFHETIVDAIKRCHGPSSGEIYHLMKLIEETEIPAGHDAIMAAIDEYFNFEDSEKWVTEIREVKEYLRSEREAASFESQSINLDELQDEATKLIALIKDRQQISFIVWYEAMLEQLSKVYKIIGQVLSQKPT